jgi:hypothetical protein
MKRYLMLLASFAVVSAGLAKDWSLEITAADKSHSLDKANVLPLALDDSFQFRKSIIEFNDPSLNKPTFDQIINNERARLNWGALNGYERRARYGHYYKFFWRTSRKADLTVRFEYRQQNLGAYVQAKELDYPGAKGSFKSEFDVIGDQYLESGKVNGWRVLLIENGKVVALNQSFLWN